MNIIKAQEKKGVNDVHGLNIGVKAPKFKAMDADSNIFYLEEALKNGPLVIIFYRGFWCPYCSKHLMQVQDSLQTIIEKGAGVIAISPQKPEYLVKMKEKTRAEFTLLYDEDYRISNAYNVTFTPENKQLRTYNMLLNAKLKETHSDDSQRLPIPATYIIDQKGLIVWRHFNPDYRKRSNVQDIIKNLPASK